MSDASEMYAPRDAAALLARKRGHCAVCPDPICVGEEIVRYDDGWAHERCAIFETEIDQELELKHQELGG